MAWIFSSLYVAYVIYITLGVPAYDMFIPRFQPKNSSFRLPYQRNSSSADYARELFIGSN